MVRVRLSVVLLMLAAAVGCTDTGAAPTDRGKEIERLEQAIGSVAPDTWALTDTQATGAGCALRDCVVVEHLYQAQPPVPDCDELAEAVSEVLDELSSTAMGEVCEVDGWRDGIVVSGVLGPDGAIRLSAHYPGT